MRLVSFNIEGRRSYGVVKGDAVIDVGRRLPEKSLRELLAAEGLRKIAALESEQTDYPLDAITFDPVIPDPAKIICVGLNYRDHVAETGRTVTEQPALFARFATSQVGHMEPIVRPDVSHHFDYEGELAVVIGRPARHVKREEALKFVAGYSCYNEGSIRDWQRHTSQFLAGKTFDRTGSFGPWLVTSDEIPDPSKLTLKTRLNGQTVQDTKTDLLITDVPGLIAYCSTIMTLLPGDVIVTGTPGGVGLKRTPPLFMKPGDVAEVEISGIGVLRNAVAAES